jgi:hypothetical protein
VPGGVFISELWPQSFVQRTDMFLVPETDLHSQFPTSHRSVPFAHPQTNQGALSKSYSVVPSHQLSHPRTCPPVLPAYSPAFHPKLVLPDSIRSLSAQTKQKRTDLFLLPDPLPEA